MPDPLDPEVIPHDEGPESYDESYAYQKGRIGRLPGTGFPKKKPTSDDPEERMLTANQDQSVIRDLLEFSNSAKTLDKQRKALKLIGPGSSNSIGLADYPEIQIVKELGQMYNDMALEDELAERRHVERNQEEDRDIPFFLHPERIKEKRLHLETMARNLKLISDHAQKVHAIDGKLLTTLVKHRKEIADATARSKAQQQILDDEGNAIDDALGKENADQLAHADLIAEARSMNIDVDAILNAKVKPPEQNNDP